MGTFPALYHFTCADHGFRGLGSQGVVRPNWHPLIGVALAWFTDDAHPTRDAVGLTAEIFTTCDRMKYRYRVVDDEAHLKLRPWLGSIEQAHTNPHVQSDLHRFSDPARWWIATKAVLVRLDEEEK